MNNGQLQGGSPTHHTSHITQTPPTAREEGAVHVVASPVDEDRLRGLDPAELAGLGGLGGGVQGPAAGAKGGGGGGEGRRMGLGITGVVITHRSAGQVVSGARHSPCGCCTTRSPRHRTAQRSAAQHCTTQHPPHLLRDMASEGVLSCHLQTS
jgi:hypothetical protein